MTPFFEVIIIGGGHAGVEAAWAAASLLPGRATVALVTQDPSRIGVMSCNPAIGGLAKGQLVREIDALNGLMGLAADASGIQFKVLNASKGPAVHGPRAQCDKHEYADEVQRLLSERPEIRIIAGSVDELIVEGDRISGVVIHPSRALGASPSDFAAAMKSRDGAPPDVLVPRAPLRLAARAVVLTTGTFMRGLMHCGECKTEGGRFGEAPAVGISRALAQLNFELGRLKTGTPPRLRRGSIRWDDLEHQGGDERPTPFSDLSRDSTRAFPNLPQVECRITATGASAHDVILANLHRAPMYSGQIESIGPRYCPSIEDKVVRFADKLSHQVFLEPESLRDDWIYCNGISTSLPRDVQDAIVRSLPGCENAEIYRYGYAVEYDMVRPHQILATGMTKRVEGLFLAGQINGTSGYEEAAAQGLIAGINGARLAIAQAEFTLGRSEAYIGVLMDDLVTKTPVEPYRMFTSRAEYRLLLRAENAADRLTPIAERIGLLGPDERSQERRRRFGVRRDMLAQIHTLIDSTRYVESRILRAGETAGVESTRLCESIRRPEFGVSDLQRIIALAADAGICPQLLGAAHEVLASAVTERKYDAYTSRTRAEITRQAELEHRRLPRTIDYRVLESLRTEARQALDKFRPATFGQAARLEGITPADMTLLAVLVAKFQRAQG